MSYSHTIALSRDLLSEGNFEAIERMIRPLADRDDVDPSEAAVVGCLLAAAALLGSSDPARALSILSRYQSESVRPDVSSAVWAEVATWLGWSLAASAESAAARERGLSFLSEALEITRRYNLTTARCWVLLGYAHGLTAAGAHDLATWQLAEASRLAQALGELSAMEASKRLSHKLPGIDLDEDRDTRAASVAAAGESPTAARSRVRMAVASGLPVLIVGERGVGKTKLAQQVAEGRGLRLVTIDGQTYHAENAASALDSLFDGPDGPREDAVVLLSRVDLLPVEAQLDLLRRLSGASTSHPRGSVRMISTAERDPADLAASGQFLPDLLRRIEAVRAAIPPLRSRKEDIEVLVRSELRDRAPGAARAAITDRAMDLLRRHAWPGNDADLTGLISGLRHALAVDPSPVIDVEHLPSPINRPRRPNERLKEWIDQQFDLTRRGLDGILADTEKALIENTLEETEGQVTAAAEKLGLTRQGLYKKMKRLDVNSGRFHGNGDVAGEPARAQ